MSRRAAIAARVRELDAMAVAALVADLWTARGYDTRRDGREVVATAGEERVVIRVGTDSDPRPVAQTADVVVEPAHATEIDNGTRLLDASALAEMLLYAVDRETRDRLCRRHLGVTPAALSDQAARRLDRSRSLTRWGLSLPGRSWRPSPAFVVALLLLVAIGGVAGLTVAPGPSGPERAVATPAGGETPVEVPSLTPTPATGVASVPGLTPDGIGNLSALATSHRRTLATRSYTAWLDRYRPRGGDPTARRVQRDVDVQVGRNRSLVVASIETNYQDRDESDRRKVLSVYETAGARYVATAADNGTRYRRLDPADPTPTVLPGPRALRRSLVTRYLATPNTSVAGTVRRDGRTLYRVTGAGVPSAPGFANVRNYSVVAFVDRRGFVRELTAEYTVETTEGTYQARFEVLFARLGRTRVWPPAWYDREFGD